MSGQGDRTEPPERECLNEGCQPRVCKPKWEHSQCNPPPNTLDATTTQARGEEEEGDEKAESKGAAQREKEGENSGSQDRKGARCSLCRSRHGIRPTESKADQRSYCLGCRQVAFGEEQKAEQEAEQKAEQKAEKRAEQKAEQEAEKRAEANCSDCSMSPIGVCSECFWKHRKQSNKHDFGELDVTT